MTKNNKRSFTMNWVEFWGRRSAMKPITFAENSILTQPVPIEVGGDGYCLHLSPTTAAIITSSKGTKRVFTEGGYQYLQEGIYTLQYVDISERFITFPRITANTNDGSEVSLTVSIAYKINNPSRIVFISSPLQTLFSVSESATKEVIRTHRNEELVGGYLYKDEEIVQHIKKRVAQSEGCKVFALMDVFISNRDDDWNINSVEEEFVTVEQEYVLKSSSQTSSQTSNQLEPDNRSFKQIWQEYRGRRRILPRPQFTKTSILTHPKVINVGIFGYYLHLAENTAAIITSSIGEKQVYIDGGYQDLQEGSYTLQYVDISERFVTFPKIAATTKDGFDISLTVSITYKINNPSRIISISSPLRILFSVSTRAVKSFIATHQHSDIFGVHPVYDDEIALYIFNKLIQHRVCKIYSLVEVIIMDRFEELGTNMSQRAEILEETNYQMHRGKIMKKNESASHKNITVNENIQWDVFISHAFEDKIFARNLSDGLVSNGLRVWFDEFELKIGDSLRRKIDFGLSNSRFGIVVLSPNFFAKNWTQKELGALVAREMDGTDIILPIWHNISIDEIRKRSPILADKFGISSEVRMDEMIIQILDKVRSH